LYSKQKLFVRKTEKRGIHRVRERLNIRVLLPIPRYRRGTRMTGRFPSDIDLKNAMTHKKINKNGLKMCIFELEPLRMGHAHTLL
jgi:hypothetical protein